MSSNDYILIEETKIGYRITHRDVETGYALEHFNPVKTLEEAVREAQKLIEEKNDDGSPIEYGIRIKFLEE